MVEGGGKCVLVEENILTPTTAGKDTDELRPNLLRKLPYQFYHRFC